MKPLSAPYCVNIVHTRKLILSFLKIFGSCLLYVGTQYAYPLFVRILTYCALVRPYIRHSRSSCTICNKLKINLWVQKTRFQLVCSFSTEMQHQNEYSLPVPTYEDISIMTNVTHVTACEFFHNAENLII